MRSWYSCSMCNTPFAGPRNSTWMRELPTIAQLAGCRHTEKERKISWKFIARCMGNSVETSEVFLLPRKDDVVVLLL